jgi:hypothetical protein
MTQDEIIKMAWDSGACTHRITTWGFSLENLVIFADAIAAKEREACAKLAEEYAAEYKEGGRLYPMLNGSITKTAASACDHIVYIIGKRGQA